LKLILVVLRTRGYDTRTAIDADEAFAVLATFRPLVILTAIQLPGMDGLEFARRLKAAATRDIFVVALSH